jgi:hypothetical protein
VEDSSWNEKGVAYFNRTRRQIQIMEFMTVEIGYKKIPAQKVEDRGHEAEEGAKTSSST